MEQVRRTADRRTAARAARAAGRLDLAALPETEELTLGLYVPDSVRVAIARGRAAAGCAELTRLQREALAR